MVVNREQNEVYAVRAAGTSTHRDSPATHRRTAMHTLQQQTDTHFKQPSCAMSDSECEEFKVVPSPPGRGDRNATGIMADTQDHERTESPRQQEPIQRAQQQTHNPAACRSQDRWSFLHHFRYSQVISTFWFWSDPKNKVGSGD